MRFRRLAQWHCGVRHGHKWQAIRRPPGHDIGLCEDWCLRCGKRKSWVEGYEDK